VGRPRKPTAVLRLTGNGERDAGNRLLREGEPVDTEPAVKPAYLDEPENTKAAAIWDEYAPALIALGTLTFTSSPVMATWCVLQAHFRKVGHEMPATLIGKMLECEGRLGMDASSRAKLGVVPKRKNRDKAEDYFPAAG
jgi:phage terminase small subunit